MGSGTRNLVHNENCLFGAIVHCLALTRACMCVVYRKFWNRKRKWTSKNLPTRTSRNGLCGSISTTMLRLLLPWNGQRRRCVHLCLCGMNAKVRVHEVHILFILVSMHWGLIAVQRVQEECLIIAHITTAPEIHHFRQKEEESSSQKCFRRLTIGACACTHVQYNACMHTARMYIRSAISNPVACVCISDRHDILTCPRAAVTGWIHAQDQIQRTVLCGNLADTAHQRRNGDSLGNHVCIYPCMCMWMLSSMEMHVLNWPYLSSCVLMRMPTDLAKPELAHPIYVYICFIIYFFILYIYI